MIKITIKANQIDMDVLLISKVGNIQKACLSLKSGFFHYFIGLWISPSQTNMVPKIYRDLSGLGLPQKVWQTSTEFYKVETELVWADLGLIRMTWSLSFDLNSKKQDRSEQLGIKLDWNSMTVYLWDSGCRYLNYAHIRIDK